MQKMKKMVVTVLIFTSLALSACGAGEPEPTPTLSPEQIETKAVSTFAAGLTQTALARPTLTPTASNTPAPVVTFALPTGATSTLAAPATSGAVGATCNGLVYVRDVTIPDNTQVTAGQAITKTWLVQNTGTCAWEAGYTFNVIGGDAMGGTALTLPQAVQPGNQYELSVPMVVPNRTGTVQGTWRMADKSGTFFGDALTVVVSVGSGPTATATTVTGAATDSNTPEPTTDP